MGKPEASSLKIRKRMKFRGAPNSFSSDMTPHKHKTSKAKSSYKQQKKTFYPFSDYLTAQPLGKRGL